MNFNQFYMFLEGKAEDLVNINPELEDAYRNGIKNVTQLSWILKVKGQEPVRDIVPALLAFERNKQKLLRKDILAYKNVGELRDALEELGKSKEQKDVELKSNETTFLGKFGPWYLVMPHTKESSCHWGKGTTWCTAHTQSGNMFFHYSAFEKVTLFYLIKEGGNTRTDPTSKISIGFKDGEVDYEDHATVDATNSQLSETSLKEILGNDYEAIMGAMKNHISVSGDNHPAAEIMQKIARGDASPRELEEIVKGQGYDTKHIIRGLTKYDLTVDGIWEIMRHFYVFGGQKEVVQDLIMYSKDHFKTANLLIDYFDQEKNEIDGHFVSVILRFGSIDNITSEDLAVDLNKMEKLMKRFGAKRLYLLSYSEVKELFHIVQDLFIRFPGVVEGESPAEKLYSMFAKYAPEWDRENIDYAIKNSYRDLMFAPSYKRF